MEHKGIKIINKPNSLLKNDIKYVASYNRFTQKITLYKGFFLLSERKKKQALAHEHFHHIFFNLMTRIERLIWRLISNGKLRPLLNTFFGYKYKKNAYVREYAKTSYIEDFASCGGQLEVSKKVFNSYVDLKLLIVNNIKTKYEK